MLLLLFCKLLLLFDDVVNARIGDNGTNNKNRMNSAAENTDSISILLHVPFNKIMKNKKVYCVHVFDVYAILFPKVVYDDEVELAVSIDASPNVFPPSWLILIIGWSFLSVLSHQDTKTLSPDASTSARVDCIPVELLKLISLPNVFPLSFDVLMNISEGEVMFLMFSAPLATT